MTLNKWVKLVIAADVVVVNLGLGWVGYQMVMKGEAKAGGESQVRYVDECGGECQRYIDNKIQAVGQAFLVSTPQPLEIPSVTPVPPTVKPTKAVANKPATKTRKEEILTIPGNGSTTSNEWANLTGTEFYFDTRDYPGLVEVYFEAQMRLMNGNGVGYVRIYDGTNNVAVMGGENNTTSQADVWVKSQPVYFWAGKNLMRVQARSLTADTAVYSQGRLRIITEN